MDTRATTSGGLRLAGLALLTVATVLATIALSPPDAHAAKKKAPVVICNELAGGIAYEGDTWRSKRKPKACLSVNDANGFTRLDLLKIRYKSKWGGKTVLAKATVRAGDGSMRKSTVRFTKRTTIDCGPLARNLQYYLRVEMRSHTKQMRKEYGKWYSLVDRPTTVCVV